MANILSLTDLLNMKPSNVAAMRSNLERAKKLGRVPGYTAEGIAAFDKVMTEYDKVMSTRKSTIGNRTVEIMHQQALDVLNERMQPYQIYSFGELTGWVAPELVRNDGESPADPDAAARRTLSDLCKQGFIRQVGTHGQYTFNADMRGKKATSRGRGPNDDVVAMARNVKARERCIAHYRGGQYS